MSEIYHASNRALAAAKAMLVERDSGAPVNVHARAAELSREFGVCAKYIRTVRTMLREQCPHELIIELREKAISVPDAKQSFEDYKRGVPADLRGIWVFYVLTPEGDETIAKVGISKRVHGRIRDLELGAGPMSLRGCWNFGSNRAAAKAVEDKVIATFPKAEGGRERITNWDHMATHKLAVAGGGLWIPSTTL